MWLSNIFDFNLKDLIFLEMLREAATFLDFNLHEGLKDLEMLREVLNVTRTGLLPDLF